MRAFRIGTFVLLLLAAFPAFAQNVDSQVWTSASASTEIAPRTSIALDSTQRFGDAAGGLYQLTLGALIGYRIAEGTEIAGGYQRAIDYANGRATRIEQRARQQFTFPIAHALGGSLTGRLRIEERFRARSDDVGVRARLQLRFARPFRPGGGLALVAAHESFVEVNDTDWGSAAGYRRMRNLIGLETPLLPGLRLQAGYLNQYDFGAAGKRDAMANVATLAISAKF